MFFINIQDQLLMKKKISCLSEVGLDDHQRAVKFWKFKSGICSSCLAGHHLVAGHWKNWLSQSYKRSTNLPLKLGLVNFLLLLCTLLTRMVIIMKRKDFSLFISILGTLPDFSLHILLLQMTIHNYPSWCLSNGPWNNVAMSLSSTTCETMTSMSVCTLWHIIVLLILVHLEWN